MLLVCETDSSSDSGAITDKKDCTKELVNGISEPVVERDSDVILSGLTKDDNQSSLLVKSHDTDCVSDSSSADELHHVNGKGGGLHNVERDAKFIQATTSDSDRENDQRILQELNHTGEKVSCITCSLVTVV